MKTKSTTMTPPNSSPKSSTTTADTNSFYFPGCRKDANCKCAICIESINATLDLVPTTQRRRTTSSATSKPNLPKTPVSFNASPSDLSTVVTPPLKSTSRSSIFQQQEDKSKKTVKRECRYGALAVKILLVLLLVFVAEYGFPVLVSCVLKTRLSPADANILVQRSQSCKDLNSKIGFLKKELEQVVGDKVASCNSVDSVWRISKDGFLLHSRCVLFESITEEVSIWGWPLQTAGLLTTDYSLQSFTLISGRVTEWSNGETKNSVREMNSSWQQGRWTSSVVQLDPNTWILEYKQSSLIENARLISAGLELLSTRLTREFEKMKHEFWQLSAFGSQLLQFQASSSIPVPT